MKAAFSASSLIFPPSWACSCWGIFSKVNGENGPSHKGKSDNQRTSRKRRKLSLWQRRLRYEQTEMVSADSSAGISRRNGLRIGLDEKKPKARQARSSNHRASGRSTQSPCGSARASV